MKTVYAFLSAMLVVALALAIVGCKGDGDSSKSSSSEQDYEIRGKVMAIDAAKPTVTLHHEDIVGWMPAMQMEFSVADAKMLEGLKVGDQVKGRIKKDPKAIGGGLITRLEKQ
jgi:Cu/Ag efflux protein CusF